MIYIVSVKREKKREHLRNRRGEGGKRRLAERDYRPSFASPRYWKSVLARRPRISLNFYLYAERIIPRRLTRNRERRGREREGETIRLVEEFQIFPRKRASPLAAHSFCPENRNRILQRGIFCMEKKRGEEWRL